MSHAETTTATPAGRDRPASGAFDPSSAGWTTAAEDGFIGLVGPIWWRHDGTGRRFGFVAEARHANLVGIVQGGMLMTFADRALGTLAQRAAGGRAIVTIAFDTQFVGPARIGSFVELDGEVVRCTGRLVFMRGRVFAQSRTIESCQGTWTILSDRGPRTAGNAAP